jgi:NAD(P)-dependent dehydrogenase (short-subunit alcohol dehydrogenase family)
MPTAGGAAPVALVTGANRGLGLETARQLAERGFSVIAGSRDIEAGEAAVGRLRADGLDVAARQLDVTDDEEVESLAAELADEPGRLDALVNNAGIYPGSDGEAAVDADPDDLRRAFEINAVGPWRCCRAFVPLLRRGAHPRIVNVSSGDGQLAEMGTGWLAYRLSKVALNALTRVLANDLRGDGILVNAVCPGWVATDMGGPGGRPVADGAAGVVWAATLPDDGATGGFFRDGRRLDW